MGATVPSGLRFPAKGDPPDVAADIRNLAEDVQSEVLRIDASIADVESDLLNVQADFATARWRHVDSGVAGAGDLVILVPSGYERLRLTMSGDMDGTGDVDLRINGDTGANYIWGRRIVDAAGNVDENSHSSSAGNTFFRLASWGTVESNLLVVDLFPVNGTQGVSILATGNRVSGNSNTHQIQFSHGKYTPAVAVTSITVMDTTASFASVRWWLEGYLSA